MISDVYFRVLQRLQKGFPKPVEVTDAFQNLELCTKQVVYWLKFPSGSKTSKITFNHVSANCMWVPLNKV